MDKNSNVFTVVFATVVCVVLASLLASTYNGLKTTIDDNKEFDKRTNVLIAMGFYDKTDASVTRDDLVKLYNERVQGEVVEVVKQKVKETIWRDSKETVEEVERVVEVRKTEHDVAELDALLFAESKKPAAERKDFKAIYRGQSEAGETVWCIPISGYGLWSTLYGFLALEADVDTVRGITFYAHGETPGLGGEVDNVAWQKTWRGKKVRDANGGLVGVALKKGIVDPKVEYEKLHMVDGLSGATITANGVTKFVKSDLETFEPYFQQFRQ